MRAATMPLPTRARSIDDMNVQGASKFLGIAAPVRVRVRFDRRNERGGAVACHREILQEWQMRAAYYESNGPAREVLKVGDVATPTPGPGEVRVKLATSGVNPSDVKSRMGRTRKIAWPRVVPHSDGAGVIDRIGDGVLPSRLGERVWVWNGQWKRAFGTAAEYICIPTHQAVKLPDAVGFEV